jgi:hypothetical protein
VGFIRFGKVLFQILKEPFTSEFNPVLMELLLKADPFAFFNAEQQQKQPL